MAGASQRHKCEIHNFTVIGDGSCPPYSQNPGGPSNIKKVTCGGNTLGDNEAFKSYRVDDWTLLPDASPMPLGETNSVAYNPTGTLLAIGKTSNPTLIVYDAVTLTEVPGPSVPTTAIPEVVFNKQGTLLALISLSRVYIYNVSDWSPVTNFEPTGNPQCLDFNHAGTQLAVGTGFGNYIYIYDTSTWTPIVGPSVFPESIVFSVDYSPDDSLLAVAGAGTTRNITIYNTSTWGKLPDPASVDTDGGIACTFNNAQTELLLVQGFGTLFVRWSTSTWNVLPGTPILPNQPSSLAIIDTDSHVAVGLVNNTPSFLVYDTSTWNAEPLEDPPDRRIEGIDFQPG